MDTIKQILLKKNRSYTACIADAYRMYFNNIKLIFRHTWAFALFFALSCALYYSFVINIRSNFEVANLAKILVALLVAFCADIAFVSRFMMLINKQSMRWNTIRFLKLILFAVILTVLCGIIFSVISYFVGRAFPNEMNIFAIYVLAITIISELFALPLIYVAMKYLMDTESKLHKILFRSYCTGLRHWGLIFTTCLLGYLIVFACTTVVSTPLLIIILADTISNYGVNTIGDLSGLPSTFNVLRFLTFVPVFFICLYICLFLFFVFYFIYGSIETKEKEKNEFLSQQ